MMPHRLFRSADRKSPWVCFLLLCVYREEALETRRCDPVKVRERWNNLLCKLSFCEVPSFSGIRSLLMFLAFRCAHRDTSNFRRLHDSFLPALRLLRSQVALSKVSSSEHCTRERGTKCIIFCCYRISVDKAEASKFTADST